MSLFEVQAALLFVGQKGDLFIMNSRKRGPYWVSSDTVRTAFNLVATDSGMLPQGVIRFGTGLSGEQWMVLYIPPARYTLQLVGIAPTLVSISVPLPGFVFAGKGGSYSLWAVKEPVIREETLVYHAPLPNVYTTSGAICIGGVSVPQTSSATILSTFRLFLEGSLFNGNLVAGCSNKHPNDVRSVLLELARSKQRTYPYEDLVPFSGYRGTAATVQDVLSSYIVPR